MKPALQVQPEAASLPADELDPEGQLLQDPAPDVSLNPPGAQGEHDSPSGPVKPALHVQREAASLPAGEEEPTMMPSRQRAARCKVGCG